MCVFTIIHHKTVSIKLNTFNWQQHIYNIRLVQYKYTIVGQLTVVGLLVLCILMI